MRTIAKMVLEGVSVAFCFSFSIAQSTYSAADYAANGDSVFLTSADIGSFDFNNSGANNVWDYSALVGTGQKLIRFRAPNQTGFTPAQWPYIQNTSNTNVSSTDGSVVMLGNLQYSDPNDYFLLNSSALSQKAVSSKLTIGSNVFSLKTVYNTPDVVYHFPLAFGNASDSSLASYTSSVPNVYYKETHLKRTNTIDGWGTLSTPYGTFTDCIRLSAQIVRIDSISVDTISVPTDTAYLRELKWFHPSVPYPLLVVNQNLVNGNYVTTQVSYFDDQHDFQPTALFAYLPLSPAMGDTVTFQNLSVNGQNYEWYFDDPGSGSDTSFAINPTHVFQNPGTYSVELVAWNGQLSDTIVVPVLVSDTVEPEASFDWLENPAFVGDTIHFQNASQHMIVADWNFGDAASGSENTSQLINPVHVFGQSGTYTVRLIVSNSVGNDTLIRELLVEDTFAPIADFTWSPDTIYAMDTVQFTNLSQLAITSNWLFGDPASGSENTSVLTNPTHIFNSPGIYLVELVVANDWTSDTLTDTLVVLSIDNLGMNEYTGIGDLEVYPNPGQDNITLQLTTNQHSFVAHFFNSLGESCLETPVSGDHLIDVSGLEIGLYTIVVLEEGTCYRTVFIKK